MKVKVFLDVASFLPQYTDGFWRAEKFVHAVLRLDEMWYPRVISKKSFVDAYTRLCLCTSYKDYVDAVVSQVSSFGSNPTEETLRNYAMNMKKFYADDGKEWGKLGNLIKIIMDSLLAGFDVELFGNCTLPDLDFILETISFSLADKISVKHISCLTGKNYLMGDVLFNELDALLGDNRGVLLTPFDPPSLGRDGTPKHEPIWHENWIPPCMFSSRYVYTISDLLQQTISKFGMV